MGSPDSPSCHREDIPWRCGLDSNWVWDYAFSQSVLCIPCFANCLSKEAFFSHWQALQNLVARLIVIQEGPYPTVHCLLSWCWDSGFRPAALNCLGVESGSGSGLLKGKKLPDDGLSGSQDSCVNTQHSVGCLARNSPFLPFKDYKSVSDKTWLWWRILAGR